MDNLLELYDLADTKGVHIKNFPLLNHTSLIVQDGEYTAIALDSTGERTAAQETCLLAHELGHFQTGCIYTAACPLQTRGRCEYRANTWAVFRLIPFDDFKRALDSGISSFYELADYFMVTEDILRIAVDIYSRKGLLCG